MKSVKELEKASFAQLKDKLKLVNPMQTPKITKVVISAGTGSMKDKKKVELVGDRLARITGQKPAPRSAKKSIASFKLRQGDAVGYQVTLRGPRMYDFLDRLINIALPRTKDFRGISRSGIDEMGNYTFGIKEHSIFAETTDEELKDVFGFAVTVVTTSKDPKATATYLEYIGFPFKKEEAKK